jgi:ribonuclease D
LPALHAALAERLAQHPGRGAWVSEECAAILARYRARDAATDYRSLGGAWRLDRRSLAILRALCAWREGSARSRDLPRSWILPDSALLRIAELKPRDVGQLAGVADIPPAVARRFGQELIDEVAQACALPDADLPAAVSPPPGPAETRRVKQLRDRVVEQAERLGVAPEMLARRRELEEMVRSVADGQSPALLAPMRGWRRAVIGDQLWAIAGGTP